MFFVLSYYFVLIFTLVHAYTYYIKSFHHSREEILAQLQNVDVTIEQLRYDSIHFPTVRADVVRYQRKLKLQIAPLFYTLAAGEEKAMYARLVTKHRHENFSIYYRKLSPLLERNKILDVQVADGINDFAMHKFLLLNKNFFSTDYDMENKLIELDRLFHTDNIIIYQKDGDHFWMGWINFRKKIYFALDSVKELADKHLWKFSDQYLYKITELMKNKGVARYLEEMVEDEAKSFDNWKMFNFNYTQQTSGAGCGFYTMINMKYTTQKILPFYKEGDVHQMRHALGFELAKQRFNPLLLPVENEVKPLVYKKSIFTVHRVVRK
ncbi:hypothetical protein SNEBB_008848 [Seison nebaliae]|nr:hypothetical protein SNEBB_008848 [Seison nebaliae]